MLIPVSLAKTHPSVDPSLLRFLFLDMFLHLDVPILFVASRFFSAIDPFPYIDLLDSLSDTEWQPPQSIMKRKGTSNLASPN